MLNTLSNTAQKTYTITELAGLSKTSIADVELALENARLRSVQDETGDTVIINDELCVRYLMVYGNKKRLWGGHRCKYRTGSHAFTMRGVVVRVKRERKKHYPTIHNFICYVPDGRIVIYSSSDEKEAKSHAMAYCVATPGFSTRSARLFKGRAQGVSLTTFEMRLLLTYLPTNEAVSTLRLKIKKALMKSIEGVGYDAVDSDNISDDSADSE